MGSVPTGVLRAAQKKQPGVAYDAAVETRSGGGVSYELTGVDKDHKTHKIRVSASGEILGTD